MPKSARLVAAFIVAGWCGTTNHAGAATIDAVSCTRADVLSGIMAAADGDTVRIPAGNGTWSAEISTPKDITILGAGIDVTNITGGGFTLTTPSGKSFRISSMTLKGTTGIDVSANSKSWRIDHIKFDNVTGRPQNRLIWIQPTNGDYTQGVIDHNNFINPASIQVHYRGPQSDGGNSSFIRPLDLGGPDAVYVVEDNIFTTLCVSCPVTDIDGGGRLVFRYNTVINSYFEMHDAIIGGMRSSRKWEVYNNTFRKTYASGQCVYIGIRGGTGVVFNNVFENAPDCDPIWVALYRTYQTGGDPWDVLCGNTSGKATLGTSTTYPHGCTSDADCGNIPGCCAQIDGPGTSPSGYPCRDQFGTDGNTPQVSRPALFWNNQLAGVYSAPVIRNGAGTYIVEGRDYAVGTATMPLSCNGMVTTYTPYIYPHPLIQAAQTHILPDWFKTHSANSFSSSVVYNVLGQKAGAIAARERPVVSTAGLCPSGVYFVVTGQGGTRTVKKIAVMSGD